MPNLPLTLTIIALLSATFEASLKNENFNWTLNSTIEWGICSWYGQGMKGSPTASGSPLDPSAYTAAHMTHPFGSLVQVTVRNRSAVVRINDRGPNVKGRILDVMPVVASKLGFRRRGLVKCEVVRVEEEEGFE